MSDEIKFLEKDRLEQWGQYEVLLKERQRPADPLSTRARTGLGRSHSRSHFELDTERDLRTVDDLFAIKDTAETLLNGWQSRHNDSDDVDDGDDRNGRSSKPEEPAATRLETSGLGSREGERDFNNGSGASKKAATRQVERETVQPGGKREVLFTDGSKKIFFADGNEKEINEDGHTTIRFTNGDRKEVRACVVSWRCACCPLLISLSSVPPHSR